MEYHTPGVYIREVDSGPKPITSVATSIPGFLGLFPFDPAVDAVAITGSDGTRQIRGKVVPQLVDSKGAVKGNGEAATTALTQAFRLRRSHGQGRRQVPRAPRCPQDRRQGSQDRRRLQGPREDLSGRAPLSRSPRPSCPPRARSSPTTTSWSKTC